jgi:hypothetical protein
LKRREAIMSIELPLTSSQYKSIAPLTKWRIMDVQTLLNEMEVKTGYYYFCRVLRKLEKKKLLESYVHPINRRKYVYLTDKVHQFVGFNENPSAINKETLYHDVCVTDFCLSLLKKGWVIKAELEHELNDKRQFKTQLSLIPDALIHVDRGTKIRRIAIELELHRKNNQRIVEKAKQYVASNQYDFVLYLFPKINFMQQYIEQLKNTLSSDAIKMFMFFTHDHLGEANFDIAKISGQFQGRILHLKDLFE